MIYRSFSSKLRASLFSVTPRQRWPLLVGLVWLLGGCQQLIPNTTPGTQPSAAAPEEPALIIRVTPHEGVWQETGFHVELILAEPAKRVIFHRRPNVPIRDAWEVQTEGISLKRQDRRTMLESEQPFQLVRLSVPPDDRFIRADYSLTQSFGPGNGLVLYLGHFAVGAEIECGDERNAQPPCASEGAVRYELTPPAGEQIWWDGVTYSGPFSFDRPNSSVGFAYFGPL